MADSHRLSSNLELRTASEFRMNLYHVHAEAHKPVGLNGRAQTTSSLADETPAITLPSTEQYQVLGTKRILNRRERLRGPEWNLGGVFRHDRLRSSLRGRRKVLDGQGSRR